MYRRAAFSYIVSLLLHLLFFLILTLHLTEAAKKSEVIFVSLPPMEAALMEEAAPKKAEVLTPPSSIAPPSDAPEAKAPINTVLRSDKDTQVPAQMIKRGLPDAGALPKETVKAATPYPPAKKTASRTSSPERNSPNTRRQEPPTDINLTNESLLQKFAAVSENKGSALSAKNKSSGQAPAESQRLAQLSDYQPFHNNNLDALYAGRTGSPDFLPGIPDGEFTLLNAKADRNAVFVRRVGLQVFGALRRMSWAELSFQTLLHARRFATVQAIMSKEGKLLDAAIVESSGSSSFDQVILQAARQGSWDQNPPPGALANDGKIHFIFRSKTWVRAGSEGFRESRWILLAAGLE